MMDIETVKQDFNITNIVAKKGTIYAKSITDANKNIYGKIIFSNFKELLKIKCCKNKINDIDDLPDSIIELDCSYNKIFKLDNLPEKSITLYCHNNDIVELNNLPSNLKYLGCDCNS